MSHVRAEKADNTDSVGIKIIIMGFIVKFISIYSILWKKWFDLLKETNYQKTQGVIENLNSPLSIKEIESIIIKTFFIKENHIFSGLSVEI